MDFLSTGIKTMAMLLLVLGFLVFVLYFTKRFLLKGRNANGNVFIKVVSSLHLSPKERIEVIDVSGERIVLGITPGSINFLTKIGSTKEIEKEPNERRHAYEPEES